jgi:hypothetical protein
MTKRTLYSYLACAALSAVPCAYAADVTLPDDGCSVLETSVKAAVRQAVDSQILVPPYPAPSLRDLVLKGVRTCDRTSRSSTAAFTAAFAEAGFVVSWTGSAWQSGNYCDGHDLSRCYPRTELTPPGGAASARLVTATWQAVSSALATFMPYGVDSDYAAFAQQSLDSSLQAHITAFVGDGEFDPQRPIMKRPHRR